jgi:hypothetical protein
LPGRQRLHQPSGVGLRDDELGRDLDRRGDLLHDRGGRHRRRWTNQLRRVLQHDDLDKIKCQHYLPIYEKKVNICHIILSFTIKIYPCYIPGYRTY